MAWRNKIIKIRPTRKVSKSRLGWDERKSSILFHYIECIPIIETVDFYNFAELFEDFIVFQQF